MRKFISFITTMIIVVIIAIPAYSMDLAKQRELIEAYLYVTGQSKDIPSMALGEDGDTLLPIKCGMPIVADFYMHYQEFDKELLKSMGLADRPERPVLEGEETHGSPDGLFLIHYTRTGPDSVYHPNVDVNLNGVPDYVDSVAIICDSVYNIEVNVMGYPAPPVDGFYPDGGDNRFDVYLKDVGAGVYGLAYVDSLYIDGPGTYRATSFLELDRDYQDLSVYKNKPLEAVKVTTAHEFFHMIQFGIDVTETEVNNFVTPPLTARYWMEMSAVWMEDQVYDNINDYRLYLPYYFNDPRNSIQQFSNYSDLHPYASAIFPMFLSEKYGQDLIKDIWLRCGETGGSSFLASAHLAIDSVSNHTENWASAFAEFAVWNYFTGDMAAFAPSGYGYEERAFFSSFPDTMFTEYYDYSTPISVDPGKYNNLLSPRHNAAQYVVFNTPQLFSGVDTTYYKCSRHICYDSTQVMYPSSEEWHMRYLDTITCNRSWWFCNADSGDVCMDSVIVPDPDSGYDFIEIDTVFDLWPILGDGRCFSGAEPTFPLPWGVSFIFQWKFNPNVYSVVTLPAPDDSASHFSIPFPDSFQSITTVFTPATYIESYHKYRDPLYVMDLGYYVEENRGAPDASYANLPSAFLKPYPNPAVVNEMGEELLWFQFQVATDSIGVPSVWAAV
ncbi:MAG: MXAN_6640 family putative metalloprotease [bacterium]